MVIKGKQTQFINRVWKSLVFQILLQCAAEVQ